MWSRQTGKGFTVGIEVNDSILAAEAAGRPEDWLLLSRSYMAARQLARKVRAIGRAMIAARKALGDVQLAELAENQFEITYPGGSRVLVLSSNPDAAAGFTGNIVIDEIDLHPQAFELLGNALPVASTKDFRVIITSTPRGRRVMYKLWTDAQKGDSPWSFHKLNIFEAVAQGCDQDPALLQRAILSSLKWRSEYLVEFVDEATIWLPWDLLVACTDPAAKVEPQPFEGDVYAGWDIAKIQHQSALWIAGKEGKHLRPLGLIVMRGMRYPDQYNRVEKTLRHYKGFRRLCLDKTGAGEPVFDEMSDRLGPTRVEGVTFTNPAKEAMATLLKKTMEERNFGIFDDDDVRDDLHSLKQEFTAAGNPRFVVEDETEEAPHADRFWAAALCCEAAGTPGTGITGEQAALLRGVAGGRTAQEQWHNERDEEEELARRRRAKRGTLATVGKGIW
jgi:phage FluMu gp28-like protein